AELPGSRLWEVVYTAVRTAAEGLDGIEGIGFSCQTPSLVLLDASDRLTGPIWTHLDRRSRPAAHRIWTEVGQEFLATTGNRPLPGGMSAVSLRQQVNDDPSLHRRVKSYLHLNGWLGLHMTGVRAFDPGNASFTGLYATMTDRRWLDRWCSYFEVNRNWLPPVMCGSTTL